ncbi:transcriptional regulatory protein Sap30p [Monosporozyma servazzii]
MARSNSESESHQDDNNTATSHGNNNTGSHGKNSKNGKNTNNESTRLTSQQQQYLKELVRTHITDNKPIFHHDGTQDISQYHPFDLQSRKMDYSVLRKYSHKYQLNDDKDNVTLTGMLLQSPLGTHTASYANQSNRVEKKTYVARCNEHYKQTSAKEMDTMAQFIYKVKFQDKNFKMSFS